MDHILKILFLISALNASLLSFAQEKNLKSESQLPVKYFSADVFRSGDISLINNWIVNTAGDEIMFIDSIIAARRNSDSLIKELTFSRKYYCEFISENWREIVKSNSGSSDPDVLGLYAKTVSESPVNVENRFVKSLSDMIRLYPYEQKIKFIGSLIGSINKSEKIFLDEIKHFSKDSFVADTSLLRLFKSYSYKKFYPEIQNKLENFIGRVKSDNFTKEDSLRGSLTQERKWWDVHRYELTVKPDIKSKTISGNNVLHYKIIEANNDVKMQLDLQSPMKIDSVISGSGNSLSFMNEKNIWYVNDPDTKKSDDNFITIYFHGTPQEAKFPPWDGGWVWSRDSLGNPWISVACEGIGASVWFPCKDHLSDEPDNGAVISLIVPEDLKGISNGRLVSDNLNSDGTRTFKWEVLNPVNNYNIIPYIGKYKNISDSFDGENGKLDIDLWMLDYNYERAQTHSLPEIKRMLKAFEHWFGPYPFYEDSYKLIDAPYAGMEHQSAIAYGNKYLNGFWGRDYSGSGWGDKWDYMIVHESGHEWFGNNITNNDIADMWIHEGFTTYSETLFTEYWYGKNAGDEYNFGLRKNIQNIFPVIGEFNVNDESMNGDMYPKGSSLLHSIRNSINDDELFRNILRGLNAKFYHSCVNSSDIENYISTASGFDFSEVFNQYLRSIEIPTFEYYFEDDSNRISYRYVHCNSGFNLPLTLKNENSVLKLLPSLDWKSSEISQAEKYLLDENLIEQMYYVNAFRVNNKY